MFLVSYDFIFYSFVALKERLTIVIEIGTHIKHSAGLFKLHTLLTLINPKSQKQYNFTTYMYFNNYIGS